MTGPRSREVAGTGRCGWVAAGTGRLVRVAEGTLERSLSQSPNVLLQFFWPEELEKQLKEQNDELQSELITLGLRVDRRRWAEYLRYPSLLLPSPPVLRWFKMY